MARPAGQNNSEQRHAQVICTFKPGRITDRGPDAQQFRASGLNPAIPAIVYWNSTYPADAVDHLQSERRAVSGKSVGIRDFCARRAKSLSARPHPA